MRTLHIFAGAGGGLLADLILGHTPVAAVEQDPYCCAVLRERAADGWFPELAVHECDVRGFDPSQYAGRVDCISAGFPCQDISAAGSGKGISGERSGLYTEVIRAVDVIRPRFVFLENSPFIRTRGRHIVIGDLVARGYAWRDGQLAASDVGAPHRRNRWWCVAADADGMRELQQGGSIRDQWQWPGHGAEASADTLRRRLESALQRGGLRAADAETIDAAARHTAAYDWAPPDVGVCRVVDGLADRVHRIKALGNGQVPLQAAAAWLSTH
ncbi:MAG: DNA cytosine methyltransferase [Burkholderiales bacterium]|nr:DNA cytosine methyltransferase [Burkholderiales bacterium]